MEKLNLFNSEYNKLLKKILSNSLKNYYFLEILSLTILLIIMIFICR